MLGRSSFHLKRLLEEACLYSLLSQKHRPLVKNKNKIKYTCLEGKQKPTLGDKALKINERLVATQKVGV